MPGQWWQVTGHTEKRQFINNLGFEMTETQLTVEPDGARSYLPSGSHIVDYLTRNPRFKGIGKVTAERLWESWLDMLYQILDAGDIDRLCQVVTQQKALALIDGWREEGLSNSLQWLQKHGIGLEIGRRILSYFGAEADAKITENPYRLLSFSAGWREVDSIAKEKLRVRRDDPRRLAAAIEEVVYRRFSLGDTYVERNDLIAGLRSILKDEGHNRSLIEAAIEHSKETNRLLFDQAGNAYSLGASILENIVVDGIQLRQGRPSEPCAVDQIIADYERGEEPGFQLNSEQRQAVHLIAENDFAVVTGGAGCGKTTVLKCVFSVLEDQGYEITQLALAGKAVKRMVEATGRPASTLASFIKTIKNSEGASGSTIIVKRALVIDEASMVDLISFSSVLRLIGDECKVVLIGDPHQLPPVGPGLILHCLAGTPGIPHVELKVAKRFGNDIAEVANAVRDGLLPGTFNETVQFIQADAYDMEALGSNLYLEKPEDSVVLCATRKIAAGINQIVQASMTKSNKPLSLFNVEFDSWEYTGFYLGDLLICTRNHWDLGVQNGSLGRLIDVFDEPMQLDSDAEGDPLALGWILWDDGEKRPLREDLLDSLELGYALTVHKSQGSQWRRVIVCLSSSMRVDRSMVYTAITRAQSKVVICGEQQQLGEAIKKAKAADRRKVGLPWRMSVEKSIRSMALAKNQFHPNASRD
jgi:exodeoxyribonuclease V alpha subunit